MSGNLPKRKRRPVRRLVAALAFLTVALLTVVLTVRLFGTVRSGTEISPRPSAPAAFVPSGTLSQTAAPSSMVASVSTAVATTGMSTTAAVTRTAVPTATAGTRGHYIQPDGAPWNLILVNDWNAVPSSYEQMANMEYFGNERMDSRAATAMRAMLKAGAAYDIRVVSAYREKSRQERLYNNEVKRWQNRGYPLERAKKVAVTIVKPPGHSEHNTGLTADLGGSGNYRLEEDFEQTAAFRWLKEHCAEYGFILRFPKGKDAITGVIYEPWHYRYVGTEHAREIMERGLSLEEYLQEKGASLWQP